MAVPVKFGGTITAVNVLVNGESKGSKATAAAGDRIDIKVTVSGLQTGQGQEYKLNLTAMDPSWTTPVWGVTMGPIVEGISQFSTLTMPNFAVEGVIDLWPYP